MTANHLLRQTVASALADCVEEVAFWTGVTLGRASRGAEGVVTNQAAMIGAGAEISLPVPWF